MDRSKPGSPVFNRRASPIIDAAVRLDTAVEELMEGRFSPKRAVLDSIDKLWSEILPAELCEHCKIVGISGGQLKVKADSASYLYELELCSSGLLRQLQRRCPAARLRRIRVVLA